MKNLILILAMLMPFAASADWSLSYDPPASKSAKKAAETRAKTSFDIHLKNIENRDAGGPGTHWYSREQSIAMLGAYAAMCFQYPDANDRVMVPVKPAAPAVCVWDVTSAKMKARVLKYITAPE